MSEPTEPTRPATTPAAPSARAGRGRRLGIIAVLLGLAAVAFWSASRMTWAELIGADGLAPPRTFTVKGSDWTPLLTPLALVLLAGIAASASLRGWALRLTAIIVAAVAVLGLLPALTLLTGDDHTSYAADVIDLPNRYQAVQVDTSILPGLIVCLGTLFAVLGAVVMLQIAARDAPMSSKYKSPAARRAELEEQVFAQRAADEKAAAAAQADRDGGPESAPSPSPAAEEDPGNNERLLWDALDTGDDPTIGPADR
ncbi:putative membrane protein (TIGR02234 family) [Williamsia limnetica]|uniref:Putative membrane protein (TIGR02234 family) n=1 Tax=Williamsia limnetica TaxID=882452 RepID=A0A318RZB7_WILLI|nr:Trp biosynthesis-associated membrane protein [Williamsia limnetica]PYE15868.1 putative membrane protein (TIGR02234 family) [Williamsia limnetica]